jgi:hypothetical protein
MRYLVFFLVFAAGDSALASTQITFSGGDFDVLFSSPVSPERLDCLATSSNCLPLNQAACAEAGGNAGGRDISITLSASSSTPTLSSDVQLIVWEQLDGECLIDTTTSQSNKNLIAMTSLSTSSGILAGGTLTYPNDFSGVSRITTGEALYTWTSACSTATGLTDLRICFGFDESSGTSGSGPDDKITSGEPTAWVRLYIDTATPPAPASVTAVARDSRISVTIDPPSSDSDVYWWALFAAPDDETTPATVSCDNWRNANDIELAVSGQKISNDVAATNWQQYRVWTCAVNFTGNVSAPLAADGDYMPTDQCDFFECYPGKLRSGYCGAGEGADWAAVLVAAGMMALLARRRIRQRSGIPSRALTLIVVLGTPGLAHTQEQPALPTDTLPS